MSRTTAPPVGLRLDADAAQAPLCRPWAGPLSQWGGLGLLGLVVLLAALRAVVGLGAAGWLVGLGCGVALVGLVVVGHGGDDRAVLGPADVITMGRGLIGCAGAALAVETVLGRPAAAALVALTVPALALDAVDGQVARRTGTVSPFGARFDGEVDAFVILVLSVALVPATGWWVLAAGLVRYAFGAAGWVLPWMRGRLEFRYWRKVVTAAVGVLLTVAVSGVLPRGLGLAAVLSALALLAESFGRDVWWLWRRSTPGPPAPVPDAGPRRRRRARSGPRPRRRAVTALVAGAGVVALALGWFALLAPTRPDLLTAGAFVRLPLEAVLLAALLVVLPARPARVVAVVAGLACAALVLVKALDLAMATVLDRPFDLTGDAGQLSAGLAFVSDSFGPWAAAGSVAAAVVGVSLVVGCLVWGVRRFAGLTTRHPTAGRLVVAVLALAWLSGAVTGVRVAPAGPFAAADAGPFVVDKVRATASAHLERQRFDRAVATDPFASAPTRDLAALRGKDVLVVFVESYGRVAVEGPGSQPVQRLLDADTARLRALGWSARSAWLTSPTFGSNSWLAHATLQSGLWVSDQGRYDRLLGSRRATLASAFGDAGWRTVALLPSTHGTWPEGRAFYGFDAVYGRDALGYKGPGFGFSAMPDQFALAALGRHELDAPRRAPVMAVVELTSSHGPWAPLPSMVSDASLGDGSVYDGIQARAVTAAALWRDRSAVPAAYRTSIEYALTSLLGFVRQHAGDDEVLVVLGDHQPSTIVSGFGGNRDVPVTVLAHDPAVLDRIAGWGWQEGLRPDAGAPVLRMDAFRSLFLAAYSDPAPGTAAQDRR